VKKVSLVVPVIHAEAPAKGLDDKKVQVLTLQQSSGSGPG